MFDGVERHPEQIVRKVVSQKLASDLGCGPDAEPGARIHDPKSCQAGFFEMQAAFFDKMKQRVNRSSPASGAQATRERGEEEGAGASLRRQFR